MRRALVPDDSQRFKLGMAHVEAVHRHERSKAGLDAVEGLYDFYRQRRLAHARSTSQPDGDSPNRVFREVLGATDEQRKRRFGVER